MTTLTGVSFSVFWNLIGFCLHISCMIPIILNQHFLPLPSPPSSPSCLLPSFLPQMLIRILLRARHSVLCYDQVLGLPQWLSIEESACNAGDAREMDSVPGPGRSTRGGHGNPLQYSCLENPTDRGAWWTAVHGVTKSWTQLK